MRNGGARSLADKGFCAQRMHFRHRLHEHIPLEPSDRTLGRAMQPAQPAALNSASGRVSGIHPQRMRWPWASASCVFCA